MRFSFLIVLGLTQLVPQTAWSEERMNVWKLDVHFSVRTERFRLIRYGSGAEELYNSKIDPHEWTNEISNPDFDSDHKRLVSLLPEAAKAVRYRKRNKK